METETISRTARLFERLMPRSGSEALIEQIWEESSSTAEFALRAMNAVWTVNRSWVWRAFNLERTVAETIFASLPFWGSSPLPALAVVVVTIGVLRFREGRIYPGVGGPREAIGDALIVLSVMLGSQVVLASIVPALAIHDGLLLARATVLCTIGIPSLRSYFNLKNYKYDPTMARVGSAFKGAWRVVVLWVLCILVLNATSVETVPVAGQERDFVLGWLPWPLLGISYLLAHGKLKGGLFHGPVIDDEVSINPARKVLKEQRDRLWKPSQVFWSRMFENVFFFVLGYPLPIGLWRWYHASGVVYWAPVITNTIVLVVLAFVWKEIKKNNARIANAIDDELAALDQDRL
jgi:hypothetical protein